MSSKKKKEQLCTLKHTLGNKKRAKGRPVWYVAVAADDDFFDDKVNNDHDIKRGRRCKIF